MTRAQQTITIGLLFASVCLDISPSAVLTVLGIPCSVPRIRTSASKDQRTDNTGGMSSRLQQRRLTDDCIQLPFWALVSFGAYLLFKLGFGVLTFNDVPQAHNELMRQIDEARKDLKKRGVSVD